MPTEIQSRIGPAVGKPLVALQNISKSFGVARVLTDVSISLHPGRIHGLVGMNGSGKSTLIKILAGVHRPDSGGSIEFGSAAGSTERSGASRPALRRGERQAQIAFVHQDLGLIDTLSIADNFALSLGYKINRFGRIRENAMDDITRRGLARVGVDFPASTLVGELGAAERTLVAIARALTQLDGKSSPSLVVDEPTAALPRSEVDRVLGVLETLADDGAAILFVTHNLGEVMRVAADVTVLRDGRVITSQPTASLTEQEIVDKMLGKAVEDALDKQRPRARASAIGAPTLRLHSVGGRRTEEVTFNVAPGEIVVLTGLVGCGKSEIGRILAGSFRMRSGSMEFDGKPYAPRSPRDALAAGVAYVPAERLIRGGILSFSATENITLPVLGSFSHRGFTAPEDEETTAAQYMRQTKVAPARPEQLFAAFSGGNQQKIVLSRALIRRPKLLVVDEPTQGVDVGAIPALYGQLRAAADAGAAVLVITSSYEEAVAVGDRAVLLDRGRVAAELGSDQLTLAALISSGDQTPVAHEHPLSERTN